ncbi:hypothetical protein LOTGIDRAFT_109151 [Lottia gigantea]|uniref:receptor protein-tyrosine kinase n=1 Tax=Lottia gigantea TaxID=225164 RepID=V3ZP65_LOTGI|nr:hypothetical protein LOTGIDRAFT_109151 [Lottia gigantea]ESO82631.1 hypothetical protein LOTGIDRAFT_109151 [Lottia gigantea]
MSLIDYYQKRRFYHLRQRLPIVIENSNRLSHRVANEILKILLKEVIGYTDVELLNEDSMNATGILDRIAGCSVQHIESVPETMINIEVWMVAGFDKSPWTSIGRLNDCGPLGPYGRIGWFMQTAVVDEFWKNGIIIDHWKSFLRPEVIEKFSWTNNLTHLDVCVEVDCLSRIYKPPICSNTTCATLFTSYYRLDNEVLQEQILNLDLPVEVVSLGNRLAFFVHKQTIEKKPVLFFDWYPNSLTASHNYTRVKLPICSGDPLQQPFDCDFDVNQFSKVVWFKIKENAPEVYNVVSKMTFSQEEYENILHKPMNMSDFDIACSWVRENNKTWKHWLPTDLSNKTKVYIGGLFPLTGPNLEQPGLVEGARLALDYVNKETDILPKHHLELIISDSECKPDVAMKAFIKLINSKMKIPLAGILGPACSDAAEPIAALSKHFNMVVVSYEAEADSLSNRNKYPYFFRTIPQVDHHRFVYEKFFKAMEWYHVGALAEAGQELPEYHIELQEHLHKEGISVSVKRKITKDAQELDVSQIFSDLRSQNVRIIIADFFVGAARAIMCEAYRQKMTAHQGYVWFLPSWYTTDWWDVDFYNSPPNPGDFRPQESVPCTTEEILYAIDGHFILTKAFTDVDNKLVAGGITVKDYKDQYSVRVEESEFSSFVYDGVWVFAHALHKLLSRHPGVEKRLQDPDVHNVFMDALNETSFQGVSGYIQFDGSDRLGNVDVIQFFHNETRLIGRYTPLGNNDEGYLEIYNKRIKWLTPTGMRPNDGHDSHSQCAIEAFRLFLGCTCDMAVTVANIMGFAAFICVTIICLVLIKCRYDAKVRVTTERMKELGLFSTDFAQCLSLDQWEVNRECVVLNRRLGEGAFGTVYGGEAFLDPEGWVAVAVKTLKIGSTMEEKLNFLSEAEVMKRFKHDNIVQLLGVCTRGEPVYCIMEFMLHGDLKTYLLSRRNIVDNKDIREAEDINATSLTQMAKDIASGLIYLHGLRYVHRDLACRNCLVHADKTVKLADFGMTRKMHDSDYYRFNRKGMLPVRWMSPESLWDGIFTAKSDVWSYGVLIYEIITFGSFPYQGLSNNQVLEYVKTGNKLVMPNGCPGPVYDFLNWCLSFDMKARPDIHQICEFLEKFPDLLTPCIEAPMTSVVMEDTDSLEMALPSNQNTVNLPASPIAYLHRRSLGSQEKLPVARKTSNTLQPGTKTIPKSQSRTILMPNDQSRRNSITTPLVTQYVNYDIHRSSSYQKQLMTLAAGDTSDYFSDNSKEIQIQNLREGGVKEICQTVTSL